jgi:hypothetical protein
MVNDERLHDCPCGAPATEYYKPWGAVMVCCTRCERHTRWYPYWRSAAQAWKKRRDRPLKL